MDELLTIIVSYHNEDDEIALRSLRSIDQQIDVNFNQVIIMLCNNCEAPLKESFISKVDQLENVSKRMVYIQNESMVGPGNNRQNGLDHCYTPWVTFMDCDDIYYSCESLSYIMVSLNGISPNTDIILSQSVRYDLTTGKIKYLKPFKIPYVWDKVWSLNFLRNNNIRFSSELFFYDDIIFTKCAFLNSPTTQDLNSIIIMHAERNKLDSLSTYNKCFVDFDSLDKLRDDGRASLLFVQNYADKNNLNYEELPLDILEQLYEEFWYLLEFARKNDIELANGIPSFVDKSYTDKLYDFYKKFVDDNWKDMPAIIYEQFKERDGTNLDDFIKWIKLIFHKRTRRAKSDE